MNDKDKKDDPYKHFVYFGDMCWPKGQLLIYAFLFAVMIGIMIWAAILGEG